MLGIAETPAAEHRLAPRSTSARSINPPATGPTALLHFFSRLVPFIWFGSYLSAAHHRHLRRDLIFHSCGCPLTCFKPRLSHLCLQLPSEALTRNDSRLSGNPSDSAN